MISLKPLLKENVIHFYEWLNDDVAIRYSLSKFQNISSREDIQLWYEEMILDQKNFTSGIFLEETEELIGYAGICGISSANKSGEHFIFIGDRNQWGKGIGTLATLQILKHGFEKPLFFVLTQVSGLFVRLG